MKPALTKELMDSWAEKNGIVHSTDELLSWIEELNQTTHVAVKPCSILESSFWFYDDYSGEILNRKRSFFSVKGMRLFINEHFVGEQPMIFQPEIGYLGIICKEIKGVLHFLMQAKIEPGNVNCVQISPTIQATKSNFTRAHGGRMPEYFDYFEHAEKYEILYDQVQSEQGSRFEGKRNRNIIIKVNENVEAGKNFRWMTLGQIKELMLRDNLVNMDTRTVLSGLPMDDTMPGGEGLTEVIYAMNNYKMFTDRRKVVVPLNELVDWEVDFNGVRCTKSADFEVAFYDIEISGREVQNWNQPLFKATGNALFGLVSKVENGKIKYLVHLSPEIGLMDYVEVGPTIQLEASQTADMNNPINKLFYQHMNSGDGVAVDVMLSEEGGRFYHEQNRNVILEIKPDELKDLPDGYFWVDYQALYTMVHTNNYLNIQLRNLMSLIQ